MGIFGRMKKITEAKLNTAIDNIEDPIELCNQRIRDMEENFRQAELSSATVIGNVTEVKKQLDASEKEVVEWDSKIRLAVAKGNDELAKKAIVRKNEVEKKTEGLKTAYATGKAQADKLKETLKDLKEEIEATRQKRDELEARFKTAQATQKVNEIIAGVSEKKNDINIDDLERKVQRKEAMAEGLGEIAEVKNDSLDNEFEKLGDIDVDSELARYKNEDK